MALNDSLAIRRRMKGRKPAFLRQDAHKKVKLTPSWRKPKGSDSKMRVRKRGYNTPVSRGYGAPLEARGLHASGLQPVLVATVAELDRLDVKRDGAVLKRTIGGKLRETLLAHAATKKITVLNVKTDAAAVAAKFAERKALKAKRHDAKATKAAEREKKEKKTLEEKTTTPGAARASSSESEPDVQSTVQTTEETAHEKEEREEKQKVLTKRT